MHTKGGVNKRWGNMKAHTGYNHIRCLSHGVYFNTLVFVAARLISIDSSQFRSQLYFQSCQAHRCYRVLVLNGGRNGYLQCEWRIEFDIKGERSHIFLGWLLYVFLKTDLNGIELLPACFKNHVPLRLKSTPAFLRPTFRCHVRDKRVWRGWWTSHNLHFWLCLIGNIFEVIPLFIC